MTAHKHASMIKAKADNMDLVLFAQSKGNETYGKWTECNKDTLPKNSEFCNYFLCLPKHKEACLHWLNGGEVEFECDSLWHSASGWSKDWSIFTCGFMQSDNVIRIKPRKEKRWIGVFKSKSLLSGETEYHNTELSYESVDELKRDVHAPHGFNGWQFIEIEVEI